MSLEEIQKKFDEESAKLEELREKMVEQENARPEIIRLYEENTMNELRPLIEEALQNGMPYIKFVS